MMQLLHGNLELEVVGGDDLSDRDNTFCHVIQADWSGCWVTVSLGGNVILTTGSRLHDMRILWGDHVTLPVCHEADSLEIKVWDRDYFCRRLLGQGKVLLEDVNMAWNKDGPVYLEGARGRVNMKIRYTPASQALEESMEVPRTYFAMREGGSLTLYQDTHVNQLPGITCSGKGLFQDMAQTFKRARKFIYITAWSVWPETRLERDKKETLGELLKKKAEEGVRVLLLIWNEKYSAGLCAGLIGTYDEVTENYFKGSGVHVEMVRRHKSAAHAIRDQLVEAVWSHHQKVVIADDGENGKDGLVAFVGGVDITRGRWDTPDHELFSTLNNEHKDDFHNGFIEVPPKHGPREPWHDIHGRLTGPATIDLLRNFEDRWRRQSPKHANLLMESLREDLLPSSPVNNSEDIITWQMQVVRSIDADSAFFDGERIGVLDSVDERVVDTSLYRSMVRMIRRAQHFLYIESQFLIGSSQVWEEDQEVCATNLIPLEIAQKVVNKIRKGEGFRVYLLLPMIPEGNPDKKVVCTSIRAIMRWQYLTMQMMYKRIAGALREMRLDHSPSDYLLCLCLGKKESVSRVMSSSLTERPNPGTAAYRWRTLSRFMIYVHSKMIIADDNHIVMGSANLNQRSVDGKRDTELAVSASQVLRDGSPIKNGEIAEFRRGLWAEHTSGLSTEERFLDDPASLASIRKLKQLSDEALKDYIGGSPDYEQRCHFLRYPLEVTEDGDVLPMKDLTYIPFFNLPVIGQKASFIPPKATT